MTSESKDIRTLVAVWFYKPAFIWLILSLIVGIWIRFEWHSPMQSVFAIPHVIHTHTHAALLGCVTLILIPFASHPPKNIILKALTPVLLLSGVVMMLLFMAMMAGLPLLGMFLFLPYQLLMAISGIVILAGVLAVSLSR